MDGATNADDSLQNSSPSKAADEERAEGIPKVIYLQYHGDGEPDDESPVRDADVTWCRDKIFEHDLEYALLTKAKAADLGKPEAWIKNEHRDGVGRLGFSIAIGSDSIFVGAEHIADDLIAAHNASLGKPEPSAGNVSAVFLREALEFYARRYDKNGKCWNWNNYACDSMSGQVSHFDWNGDEQDEPWEIAERVLSPHPNVAGADQVTKERAALVKLAEALTCRGDDTHYCPKCDNSLFNAKQIVDNALASPSLLSDSVEKEKEEKTLE